MKYESMVVCGSILEAVHFQEKMEKQGYETRITIGVNNAAPNGFIRVHYSKEKEDEDED